jgi:hypothetical protein
LGDGGGVDADVSVSSGAGTVTARAVVVFGLYAYIVCVSSVIVVVNAANFVRI